MQQIDSFTLVTQKLILNRIRKVGLYSLVVSTCHSRRSSTVDKATGGRYQTDCVSWGNFTFYDVFAQQSTDLARFGN